MIARLQGTVADIHEGHIVLDVGGVGYLVAVRNPSLFVLDDTVILHTHLAVRENALDLYGFLLRDELDMYEKLLTIPKIGPKSALQILTQADVPLLKQSIATQDPSSLSKLSGIGKKSAEKIVAGLKDHFADMVFSPEMGVGSFDNDALDALIALGYSERDAATALKAVADTETDTNNRIKAALRHLGT